MKKFTLIPLFVLSASLYSADASFSPIYGGGDSTALDAKYIETGAINDANVTINSTGSGTQYAGSTGGAWTYTFLAENNTVMENYAVVANASFKILNNVIINYASPNHYDNRDTFTFNAAKADTVLYINNLTVTSTNNTNTSNYTAFSGLGKKVIGSVTDNYICGLVHLAAGTLETTTDLTLQNYKNAKNTVLSLGGSMTVKSAWYMSWSSASSTASNPTAINLNGYDFIVKGLNVESSSSSPIEVTISYGEDANDDGYVLFAIGSAYIPSGKDIGSFIITDFKYGEDLFLVQTPFANIESKLVFEGYEGKEIQSKVLTEMDIVNIGNGLDESYIGYTSYYVIPEPSTYALFFGILALGFVAYKRRR